MLTTPRAAWPWSYLQRARRGLATQRATMADVLAAFLAIKVGFYVLALFATWMVPEYAGNEYPRWYSGADRLIDISWRWDGEWYMSIAREGYYIKDGYANVAFFPLYPLLFKLLGLVLGEHSLPLAGVVVANVAFLAAMFYLHRLAEMDGGRSLAQRAIWYVAIMPSAFFFHAAYSEALFLLTAAATIYYVRRGNLRGAGVWAALAAVTRAQGVLLVLPIVWELLGRWRRERRPPWRDAAVLLLPVFSLSLFMAHLYRYFGDPLAFLHVQSEWGRALGFPLYTIWEGLRLVFAGYKDAAYPLETLNTVVTLAFLVVALLSIRRWPAAYTIYVVGGLTAALILPAEGRPIESGARFMAVLFPVVFRVAAWAENRPALERLITAVSLPLYALLTILFVNWYWVV